MGKRSKIPLFAFGYATVCHRICRLTSLVTYDLAINMIQTLLCTLFRENQSHSGILPLMSPHNLPFPNTISYRLMVKIQV